MIRKDLPLQRGNSEPEDTKIQFVFRNILMFSTRLGIAVLVLCLLLKVLTELSCTEFSHNSCYNFLMQFLLQMMQKAF